MKKILVLTDLSPNSRAGIIFAIQLALRSKSTLVFFHVVELLKPARWSEKKFRDYLRKELESHHKKLVAYVENGFRKVGGSKPQYQCVVTSGHHVANSVIAYAEKTNSKAICLSTGGAGNLRKLIGTTASKIISKSKRPVFAIPVNYQRAPLTEVFYATDLINFESEMKQIEKLADLTGARITACHYDYFPNLAAKIKHVKQIMKSLSSTRHRLRIRELQPQVSLSSHMLQDIEESHCSLAVLFTDHNKSWFKKIFSTGNSAELSFSTKKPLLIFEK